MTRRVAVTGLGVVSALGRDTTAFWEALSAGRSGIRPITALDCSSLRFCKGAEAVDFQPGDWMDSKEIDLLDRFAQMGWAAASQAVTDSGVVWPPGSGRRTAIVTGSCVGGQTAQDIGFQGLYLEQKPRVHPLTIVRTMSNGAASFLSLKFGITGPVWSVSTACSSANHAIGQALWMVRHGLCDRALAGGAEAPFSLGFLKAWEAMRVVSPDTCRPFSKDRSGLILGEGAAMLVLEPWEEARARGAHIYAELAGFGMTADAYHVTQPSVEGPAAAMRAALDDAGLDPGSVGYINAHGTGTTANDPTETAAIHAVFGHHARRLVVSSTKSMHGHALGAAGALEAVATILALDRRLLPPTANFTVPDPQCDLDVAPNEARAVEVEAALSNSFAFGGLNAVLAFRRAR